VSVIHYMHIAATSDARTICGKSFSEVRTSADGFGALLTDDDEFVTPFKSGYSTCPDCSEHTLPRCEHCGDEVAGMTPSSFEGKHFSVCSLICFTMFARYTRSPDYEDEPASSN